MWSKAKILYALHNPTNPFFPEQDPTGIGHKIGGHARVARHHPDKKMKASHKKQMKAAQKKYKSVEARRKKGVKVKQRKKNTAEPQLRMLRVANPITSIDEYGSFVDKIQSGNVFVGKTVVYVDDIGDLYRLRLGEKPKLISPEIAFYADLAAEALYVGQADIDDLSDQYSDLIRDTKKLLKSTTSTKTTTKITPDVSQEVLTTATEEAEDVVDAVAELQEAIEDSLTDRFKEEYEKALKEAKEKKQATMTAIFEIFAIVEALPRKADEDFRREISEYFGYKSTRPLKSLQEKTTKTLNKAMGAKPGNKVQSTKTKKAVTTKQATKEASKSADGGESGSFIRSPFRNRRPNWETCERWRRGGSEIIRNRRKEKSLDDALCLSHDNSLSQSSVQPICA